MSKENKTMGVGSIALPAALLGTICLIRVNDNSLYDYLFGLMGVTNQYITPIILIALSILGAGLGVGSRRDWGAKVGLVWCTVNVVLGFTVIGNLFS